LIDFGVLTMIRQARELTLNSGRLTWAWAKLINYRADLSESNMWKSKMQLT
jgi:hypothetical protein